MQIIFKRSFVKQYQKLQKADQAEVAGFVQTVFRVE